MIDTIILKWQKIFYYMLSFILYIKYTAIFTYYSIITISYKINKDWIKRRVFFNKIQYNMFLIEMENEIF